MQVTKQEVKVGAHLVDLVDVDYLDRLEVWVVLELLELEGWLGVMVGG